MLISSTHKFIFFHGAKVAGTSIRVALEDYSIEPRRFRIDRPPPEVGGRANPLYVRWRNSLEHAKARDAKRELPSEVYDNYFKFGFVRNPWDWQVSMYHFILKEREHIRHQRVKAMASFESYLEWVSETKTPYPRGAAKFQRDMYVDERGNIAVDFIGRYETLDCDFEAVCRRLDITASMPHLNRSYHTGYRDYYTARTRQWVANYFAQDIDLFGYSF